MPVMEKVEIPVDPYAWDLYRRKVGSDEAAQAIGAELRAKLEAVDRSDSYEERREAGARIREEMHQFMEGFARWGATDSEPKMVLTRVISDYLEVNLARR